LSKVKKLRERASANMRGDAEKFELGIAQKKIATALEDQLDRHLETTNPALIQQFRNARQQFAKIYSVEDALTPNGNISPAVLARQLNRGVPLSAGLKDIAEAYLMDKRAHRTVDDLGGKGEFSRLDVLVGGAEMLAHPERAGIIAAALGARPLARAAITSKAYQSRAIGPTLAEPGIAARAARGLTNTIKETERQDILRGITANPRLSGKSKQIETKFANEIASNFSGKIAEYNRLKDSENGKILSTDTARELSKDYLKDRTESEAVHEPASYLIKKLYAQKLKEAPKLGEDASVLFTAGGTGAGKTTAIKNIPAAERAKERSQMVYDTNLDSASNAIPKIDQALKAGKTVKIAYVYRDPVSALTQGALPRSMNQIKEFGTGRTVPLKAHLRTHLGSNKAIREIAEHYKDNSKVEIEIIDNSHGRGNAKIIAIDELPELDYGQTHGEVTKALDEAYSAGRITPEVYAGFKGKEAVPTRSMGAGPSGQPESQRSVGEPARLGQTLASIARPKGKLKSKLPLTIAITRGSEAYQDQQQ